MQTVLAVFFLLNAPVVLAAGTGEAPQVKDKAELDLLLGVHPFTLQWIGWDKPGRVVIAEEKNQITLRGKQEDKKAENLMTIDGVITEIDKRMFRFKGKIVYRVTHLNQGKPCTRKGTMTFRRRGKRKYWRLMQMSNPCDGVTDYIDVFVKKPKQRN